MSEVLRWLRAKSREAEQRVSERIGPRARRIRVLRIYPLGPYEAEIVMRWAKEPKGTDQWRKEGSLLRELLMENMELRGKYTYLEARLTMEADRIASRKLRRIFRAAREVSGGGEGED